MNNLSKVVVTSSDPQTLNQEFNMLSMQLQTGTTAETNIWLHHISYWLQKVFIHNILSDLEHKWKINEQTDQWVSK